MKEFAGGVFDEFVGEHGYADAGDKARGDPKEPGKLRETIECARYDEGMQEIEAVAGITEQNEPARSKEGKPARLLRDSEDDGGESGR